MSDRREHNKAYRAKNRFELQYISQTMYSQQLRNSRKRGHNPPEYSLEELREWMQQQPQLERLIREYRQSGGEKDLAVSVDRLNDEVGYTYDNIQLGTWKDNRDRGNINKPARKTIIQMTLEGEFIKEWTSTTEAAKALGLKSPSSISMALSGMQNTAGGYKFKFS